MSNRGTAVQHASLPPDSRVGETGTLTKTGA